MVIYNHIFYVIFLTSLTPLRRLSIISYVTEVNKHVSPCAMCTLYTRDAGQTRGVLSHAPGLDAGDLIMQPNHSARGMPGTPTDPLAL